MIAAATLQIYQMRREQDFPSTKKMYFQRKEKVLIEQQIKMSNEQNKNKRKIE